MVLTIFTFFSVLSLFQPINCDHCNDESQTNVLVKNECLISFSGNIDSVKAARTLLENGSISSDVVLIFDEMYLQKCEEYVGGESYGADEEGNLYKGLVCFMIVGLKENVPFIIKSVPEIKISGDFLQDELKKCIQTLQSINFNVRAVVADNHSSNVAAFNGLTEQFGRDSDPFRVWVNDQPIYLFYDAVHLVKNIRNNLLNQKRLLFPPFICDDMDVSVKVAGGEISWSLLHRVHEKDQQNQANIRSAPKLSSQVLHPGNCKQSVPVALAIFDPSTIASILKYFPSAQDSADFLQLFNTWWTISNAKSQYNRNNRIGHAAITGDGKPKFLRKFADWLEDWRRERIPNAQKFTLSAQTTSAMIQTLRCQASLIEDLLFSGYKFVLTARFQSDPLEKRYGQYRQMSGGRFLVSAKDVGRSENILKVKSLIKEGFDIKEFLTTNEHDSEDKSNMLKDVECKIKDVESLQLNESSRDVSNHIAGYIAHKARNAVAKCCGNDFISTDGEQGNVGSTYTALLSRGRLVISHQDISDAVSKSFALLDNCSAIIRSSKLPSRVAGLAVLQKYITVPEIACKTHQDAFSMRVLRAVCNCFFDCQRKRSNESVVNDRVQAFKKSKRSKE